MKKWIWMWALLVAGSAGAAELATLEHCEDASGRALTVRQDPEAARPAAVTYEDGKPVLVVNGAALPGLSADAQGFLFARACAQAAAGSAARHTSASAAAADCAAITAMVRSGLLDSEARVAAIEASLSSADRAWNVLPGPPRNWALRSCFRRASAGTLPEPLADQPGWNQCVHRCGETLRRCQKDHFQTTGHCMSDYESCSAVCDFRAE